MVVNQAGSFKAPFFTHGNTQLTVIVSPSPYGPPAQQHFLLSLGQKYKDVEPTLKIKEVDGLELVKKFSEQMESMLRRKVEAVEVRPGGLREGSPLLVAPRQSPPSCLHQERVGAEVARGLPRPSERLLVQLAPSEL